MSKRLLALRAVIAYVFLDSRAWAAPPDVTFQCSKMPEVCTNMCWAVRCASPVFPQTLSWDDPDETTQGRRLASAGCQKSGNKCGAKSKDGVGHRGGRFTSCDEYPFVSTKESTLFSNGHQVSRCVPRSENARRRQALKAVYGRWKKQGLGSHGLAVSFGSPAAEGVNYCTNQPCKNDGFEVQDKQIKKRGQDPVFKFYAATSGIVLGSLEQIETPSNFTRLLDNDEATPAHCDSWVERVGGADIRVISDVLLEELSLDRVLTQA
ncbi:hypothetical protein CDD83_3968 [Cordyceps sp. RAO-2017]|nr:hypothetical protein CDD83_3968 [Cordyceps sp. RAO-2017]